MNYEQFIDYIRENMIKILGDNYTVAVHKVLKNNDIELDALIVTEETSYISPTIYLNQYFTEYEEGRKIGDILNDIYHLYEEHRDKMEFDLEYFKDFNKIKARIAFKLVNASNNERLLCDVPYIPLLDLAIVFYCLIDSEYVGSATALIHQSHLDMWDITIDDLYEIAVENTPKILEFELKNMNEIIKEIFMDDLRQINQYTEQISDASLVELFDDIHETRNTIPMYVLTNKQKINGAACMLYNGVLETFAHQKKEDLYILPSSIHEVILVPAMDELSKEQLNSMVREVNAQDVEVGDVLSNHVYIYRRDIGQICM